MRIVGFIIYFSIWAQVALIFSCNRIIERTRTQKLIIKKCVGRQETRKSLIQDIIQSLKPRRACIQLSNYIQILMGNSKSLYSKADQLYYYIEKNDMVNINKLLETNENLISGPISKDTKQSALMRASYNGNIELAQHLLKMKAEVNYITPKGQTALTIAIKRNHAKIVEELIEAGADIGHVSSIGLRVIEYAILPGFYDICQLIYKRLTLQQKRAIQDPESYTQLAKKYTYRYVNYTVLLEGLVLNREESELPNFLKKEKKKFVDPVVDPRQTWKQWFKRQLEWKDAPLVERESLPENLQPQNRLLGKVHHYTNNFMSTHLSQKTSLKPNQNRDTLSEMADMHTKKMVEDMTEQKMNYEARSEV